MKNIKCPHCGKEEIIKYGIRSGKQRFKCNSCKKTFFDTTKTIFSSTKLSKEKLYKIILLIIDDTKLKAIQDILSISIRTVYMWRMKIYKNTKEIMKNVVLSGKVWIDETYVVLNRRYIKRRPDGKKIQGINSNQVIVVCAVDEHGNKYAEVVGRGHITSNQCIKSYGQHIKPGSHIIHDGIFSHDKLIKHLNADDEVWKSTAKSSKYHMQPVNSLCSEIKRALVVHLGIRTENLQDYINWIIFKSTLTKENIDKKVKQLVDLCFQFKFVYCIKDRYHQ